MDPRDPSRHGSIFPDRDDDDLTVGRRSTPRQFDRDLRRPPPTPADNGQPSSPRRRLMLGVGAFGGVLLLLVAGYVAGSILTSKNGIAATSPTLAPTAPSSPATAT